MASLFDTLQTQAFRAGITARTKQSSKWFQKKVGQLAVPARSKLMKDDALIPSGARTFVGSMYMYFYDPKLKKELPYYDRFPLVLPLERYSDGFLGINLHYLPIPLRVRLLDELMDYSSDTRFDSKTKINTNYQI